VVSYYYNPKVVFNAYKEEVILVGLQVAAIVVIGGAL
jgi:hypothetical protein